MTGNLQIKNGKYYAVINLYVNGKRKPKWISTGFDVKGNKKKAEQFLRDKIKEYELRENLVSSDVLFSDYINYWLDSVRIGVDVVTYRGYKWICDTHIKPYFQEKKIKLIELSLSDVQSYIDQKYKNGRVDKKGGLSPKTLKEHKLIIQSVCKNALKNNLISKNPCDFVKLPSLVKKEPSFYNRTQVEQMFNSFSNELLFPLIYVTVLFGLRREEVLGLKWDSIDFDRNFVTIKHTVVRYQGVVEKDKTKNKSSYRSYPMNNYLKSLFSDLKEKEDTNRKLFGREYIDNQYVFKWDNGKPFSPDYVSSKFSKLLKKYGLPHIRFHDLRHTCASLLIDNDYQLKDIQEWLGHADIQTTANIYGHLDVERKRQISNAMVDMFN